MSKHIANGWDGVFPLTTAFENGQHSFKKGVFTNAYPKGSDQDKEWQRGFNAAYFANLTS